MKITSVTLHQIAGSAESFCYDLPQFVFAGKSNVGKSSLLRTLVNRKKLVRVGQKPGVTRLINFFKVNEQCYFVDLPGYGYAKISKSMQKQWKQLLEQYFREAINIRRVLLLLDVRREISEKDMVFYNMIVSYHLPVMVIITKSDKVSRNQARKKQFEICRHLQLEQSDCILFSALNREGREEILTALSATL